MGWGFSKTNDTASKSVSAQDQWTDAIWVDADQAVIISAVGTEGSKITVQRAYEADTAFRTVNSFTTYRDRCDIEPKGAWWRVGVATGDYSTAVALKIEKGSRGL